MGKNEDLQYTPEELQQYAQAVAAKESAVNNGLYAQLAQNETASTREFYLAYEDSLTEQIETWRGKMKQNGEWIEPDPQKPGQSRIMTEEAISMIIGMIRSFLTTHNRLANQDEDMIRIYAYQGRDHISRFLHKVAWLKYKIPHYHLRSISFQSGQTIHAALTWSKNAGGQRFMTRSIISHENINQLITKQGQDDKKKGEAKRPW